MTDKDNKSLHNIAVIEHDEEIERKLDKLESKLLQGMKEIQEDIKMGIKKELEKELPDLTSDELDAAVENEFKFFVRRIINE